MSASLCFVDTNILVYAHDLDAGRKRERASEILRDLWDHRTGIISVQVLQEFYVNVTRKIPSPLPPGEARSLLEIYRVWPVEAPTPDTVLRAAEIQERNRLSFWDAMIITTAENGGADILLSEDLNDGQMIEGVRIQNPFGS